MKHKSYKAGTRCNISALREDQLWLRELSNETGIKMQRLTDMMFIKAKTGRGSFFGPGVEQAIYSTPAASVAEQEAAK